MEKTTKKPMSKTKSHGTLALEVSGIAVGKFFTSRILQEELKEKPNATANSNSS